QVLPAQVVPAGVLGVAVEEDVVLSALMPGGVVRVFARAAAHAGELPEVPAEVPLVPDGAGRVREPTVRPRVQAIPEDGEPRGLLEGGLAAACQRGVLVSQAVLIVGVGDAPPDAWIYSLGVQRVRLVHRRVVPRVHPGGAIRDVLARAVVDIGA